MLPGDTGLLCWTREGCCWQTREERSWESFVAWKSSAKSRRTRHVELVQEDHSLLALSNGYLPLCITIVVLVHPEAPREVRHNGDCSGRRRLPGQSTKQLAIGAKSALVGWAGTAPYKEAPPAHPATSGAGKAQPVPPGPQAAALGAGSGTRRTLRASWPVPPGS